MKVITFQLCSRSLLLTEKHTIIGQVSENKKLGVNFLLGVYQGFQILFYSTNGQ